MKYRVQYYLIGLFEKIMDLDHGFWDYLNKHDDVTEFINVVSSDSGILQC